ncbi:MAG: hypothetical protein EOO11_22250, partial [Chitinophagaceae bacterium]
MHRLLLMAAFIATGFTSVAQNLTGTWEGGGPGAPFLRIGIIKCGGSYYGYTYDRGNGADYCRTDFQASFDEGQQLLRGTSLRFTENRGGHILCSYKLAFGERDGRLELMGDVRPKSGVLSLITRLLAGGDTYLKRVSERVDTTAYMLAAIAQCLPVKDSVAAPPPPPPLIEKPAPTPVSDTASQLVTLRQSRRADTATTITTSERTLTFRVFDNGVADGDI